MARECDLALVGARGREKQIVYVPFGDDEVVLVARPDMWTSRARISARELGRVRLIVREEGSGTRQAVAAFLARHASARGDHVAPLQAGSTEAARRCALQGIGMALLSRQAIAADVEAGRLVVVSAPNLPVRRRFYAARLRTATPPAAMQTFLKMVVQQNR